MSSGLWLFDASGNQTAEIAEYNSIVTTVRYREHSEFAGMFSPSDYDTFAAAYFAIMSGEPEVYLVEKVKLTKGAEHGLEVSGRSASALLSTRTMAETKIWSGITASAMIEDMMDDFTGDRALALEFGTGSGGSTFSLQRSWGDCGEIALEVLAAQDLGMRTRMDGTTVKLDVYAASDAGLNLGEKFSGTESTARLITDEATWRNYAYVLGEVVTETKGVVAANCTTVDGTLSGSYGNLNAVDEYRLNVTEDASDGITVTLGFLEVPAGSDDVTLVLNGYYDGTAGHYIRAQVATDGSTYETVQEVCFDGTESAYRDVRIPLGITGLATTGRIKLIHNTTTYNSGHKLYLNAAWIEYSAPRAQVEVDQTSGAERRELYVDARDLQRGTLSESDYEDLLDARGASKLADTRRLEYAEAEDVTTALSAGDVVWFDAGVFGASFMVSEVESVHEGGGVTLSAAMGEPPPTLARALRRYLG